MTSAAGKVLLLSAALLLASGISGCASTRAAHAKADAQQAQKIKKVGEPLLKAFVKNDAKAFLGQLPEIVAEEFGENGFKKTQESMQEQLGKPISYEYVFNLEHPRFIVSVWKIRFERKSSDLKKKIYQETLFRAVSAEIDGKEKLLSFNFF